MVDAFINNLQDSWSWTSVTLGLISIAAVVVLAFVVDVFMDRFVNRVQAGHGPWRCAVLRTAPVVRLTLLTLVVLAIGAVLWGMHPIVLLGVVLVGIIATSIASVDLFRSLFAGALVNVQKPFNMGDWVQVGEFEGEVLRVGVRATVLMTADGKTITVPNRRLLSDVIVNIGADEVGAPVRVLLPIPTDMDVTAARAVAYRAACLSKYNSPRRRPEVIVERDPNTPGVRLMLAVRVYPFDSRYADQLRGEVTEILAEALQSERV